jgi:hypothetical protein
VPCGIGEVFLPEVVFAQVFRLNSELVLNTGCLERTARQTSVLKEWIMQRLCEPKSTHPHEKERVLTPKIVLGMMDGPLAASLEKYFLDLGWRVCTVNSTSEVRRKAHGGRAAAVVIPVAAFVGESAFLTCAKLVRSLPKVKVVLVGPDSEEQERFALFAGAAGYVPDTTSASEVAKLLLGRFVAKPN